MLSLFFTSFFPGYFFQVVGVVDSGIDMLNCFFFDPDYAAAQGASAPFYPLPAVGSDIAAPTTAGWVWLSYNLLSLSIQLCYPVVFISCCVIFSIFTSNGCLF